MSYSGGTATEWTSGTQPYAVSNGVYGGGGSAASGQITATFTWDYFQDGSDEPPDSVYVLETCSAGGMSDNMHSAPTGDNGLASGTVFSSTSPAPGYIQTTANSSGTQLTCYIIGGAHSFSVTASPSASGFQGSSVQYTAAVVQKAVTIDASNDESFHKGPDGTPVSNLTEVATPKYGDIGIDPNAAIYNFGAWWYPVTISFSTELLRTWNRPVHSWDVDGTTYTDDFFSTYTSVPGAWTLDAATVASMGSGGSLDKIVTLTVNEAQQQSVSASALFHMRIHNLYDDWQNFGSPWPIYEEVQNFQIDNPGYAQAGGGIQCTWSEVGPMWSAMLDSVGALSEVTSAVLEDPIYEAGFAVAGIAAADLGAKPMNGVAPWAWGWPGSTIAAPGSWSDDPNLYRMVPSLEEGYNLQEQLADKWGAHGYEGTADDIKAKPNGSYRWTGEFFQNPR